MCRCATWFATPFRMRPGRIIVGKVRGGDEVRSSRPDRAGDRRGAGSSSSAEDRQFWGRHDSRTRGTSSWHLPMHYGTAMSRVLIHSRTFSTWDRGSTPCSQVTGSGHGGFPSIVRKSNLQ